LAASPPSGEAAIRSKGQIPYMHHIEILVTEQNPGIVFIFCPDTFGELQI
jgi:hypothetical protein